MLKNSLFEGCVDQLVRLPGIGRKTAQRLALYFISMEKSDVDELLESIRNLRENIKQCKICGNLAEDDLCYICKDKDRDKSVICIVEKENDVSIIESTGRYNGLYHVLGGRISPIEGITPDDLNINSLLNRINDNVKEIIIATNADPEGDTTALYIAKLLKRFPYVIVSRIASGLPIGGFLEYSDSITVLKSLENRRPL
ncbi:MAG: recombination mediator RecR [Deferribacterota bacterium]|nr:recombination mediator RecR [Deferribacterota bacterium]